MHRRTRAGVALTAATLATLVSAASAQAGRIEYTVPPSPTGAYAVDAKGNGNGIVKVTFNSCATEGQALVLPLDLAARGPVKGKPTADWKVLKDGAADLSFDPAVVTFDGGTERTRITITPTAASESGAKLRIKLHGQNGSGLGEGPGIMVDLKCVLAPPPPAPPAATPTCPEGSTLQGGPAATRDAKDKDKDKKADDPLDPAPGNGQGNQGVGNGNGGPAGEGTPAPAKPDDAQQPVCVFPDGTTTPPTYVAPEGSAPAVAPASITTPTVGAFPTVGSSLASRTARCVAKPTTTRAVAGEQATIRVQVRVDGVAIRGAAVRVTTPNGTVTKRSDKNGVVVFRVRPSKSGRITIQADSCFGSRVIRVRGARVSGRQGVSPQFTG